MDKLLTVAQVIAPIFITVLLGFFSRKNQLLSEEGVRGMQQFVMKFGLPCVIFNSCLTAKIGAESLTSMVLVVPSVALGTLWAFRARRKQYPYFNLPQLFTAQETGMLGIPLFMILFGVNEAYRMGVLDLAQAVTAYPTIAILSAGTGSSPSLKGIVKNVLTSPLLIMSMLGLALNVSGIGAWLDNVGILGIITESTGFLGQPISAMMIFSVGYNFSLDRTYRKTIFRISILHFLWFALWGLAAQGILFLIPQVDPMTRWVLLLYFLLPASYLAPTLGQSQEDFTVASGVCSLLTVVTMAAFGVMAMIIT